MRILCLFGIHSWGKYGKLVSGYGSLTQFRKCSECGRVGYAKCYGDQATPEAVKDSLADNSECSNNKKDGC